MVDILIKAPEVSPVLVRGTAVVDALPPTVAAALAEPWLIRDSLAPLGIRLRAGRIAQLTDGDRVLAVVGRVPTPVRLVVVRADETGLAVDSAGGWLSGLRVRATLAATAAGTLITYGIGWSKPYTAAGRVMQVVLGRRLVLRMLPPLLDGVRGRAEQLAGAPVVVGAVIMDGERVLAAQRDRPPVTAGRWEFPGGRVEPGEDERAALVREIREELGADIQPGHRVGPDLVLPNGWVLRLYVARLTGDGQPAALEHRAVRWLRAADLPDLDWLDPDRVVLPAVIRQLSAGEPGSTPT